MVKDDGKTEIDANTTVEGTGKITQGTQVAPVAPTVSVDQKTNNIVVAGPLGDNIEYSINGTDWQTGTTFTGLENGKAILFMQDIRLQKHLQHLLHQQQTLQHTRTTL